MRQGKRMRTGTRNYYFFLLGLIYKNIAIHVCSGLITHAIKRCYSCLPLVEEILFTLHLRLYNLFIIKRACTDLEFLINHCAGKLYIQKQVHCWHYTTNIALSTCRYKTAINTENRLDYCILFTIVGTDIALTTNMGAIIEIYCVYCSRLSPTTISHTVQWKLSLFTYS
jgi:uncharacterized membrane protein